MKKSELRVAVQEMDTYQFGLKNELHNKLTKVTSYVPKKEVIDLINQLEEPEQEKVTIPDFIAEYIESLKYRGLNFYSGYRHAKRCSDNGKNNIQEWLDSQENLEIFARAWLDGYTVEKEKMYRVVLIKGKYLIYNRKNKQLHNQELDAYVGDYEQREFTEQEIKSIDERYWAFAEEITK